MISNSLISFIRSVRMPFDNMSSIGRLFVAIVFLITGIGSLYVGLTASYPVIIVGAILLFLIGLILTLPGKRMR